MTKTTKLGDGYGRAKVRSLTLPAGQGGSRIALDVGGMGVEMSPAQARKLAKLLLDAAAPQAGGRGAQKLAP